MQAIVDVASGTLPPRGGTLLRNGFFGPSTENEVIR
jgi:hypothetical protein